MMSQLSSLPPSLFLDLVASWLCLPPLRPSSLFFFLLLPQKNSKNPNEGKKVMSYQPLSSSSREEGGGGGGVGVSSGNTPHAPTLTLTEDDDGDESFLGYPGDEEHLPSSPSPSAPKMPLILSLWVLFLIALLSCGPPYFAYHAPGKSSKIITSLFFLSLG